MFLTNTLKHHEGLYLSGQINSQRLHLQISSHYRWEFHESICMLTHVDPCRGQRWTSQCILPTILHIEFEVGLVILAKLADQWALGPAISLSPVLGYRPVLLLSALMRLLGMPTPVSPQACIARASLAGPQPRPILPSWHLFFPFSFLVSHGPQHLWFLSILVLILICRPDSRQSFLFLVTSFSVTSAPVHPLHLPLSHWALKAAHKPMVQLLSSVAAGLVYRHGVPLLSIWYAFQFVQWALDTDFPHDSWDTRILSFYALYYLRGKLLKPWPSPHQGQML